MERKDKENFSFTFELAYTQVIKHTPYPYLNFILLVITYILTLAKFYDLVDPILQDQAESIFSFFIVLASLTIFFLVLTIISYNFQILSTLWIYILLIIQSLQIVFIEIGVQCFIGSEWCHSDPKLQTACLGIQIVFCLAILLRSRCYSPFNETNNPLSMNTGKTVLYFFVYSILVSLATNQIFQSTSTGSKQITFLITLVFFALTNNPPTCSPLMSRGIFTCGVALLWTSGLIWVLPLAENVLSNSLGSIWYYWGFSMPIILGLAWTQSSKFQKGYEWRALFFQNKDQSLKNLFLQVNELTLLVGEIKKSQLHTNSPQFRSLWNLITDHNQRCTFSQCPLFCLQTIKIGREDQLLQEKRFNRTLQKTLEFALLKLTKQHDTYPNLLQLSLEIANFELEVFHLRTKGLQLFNRQFGKGRSTDEQWSIFFIKRKVENFQGTGEAGIGERQEQIQSFKHSIEVSVSMLAEFWYFLSDPKCNIKKLYDLANVLFPLKIGVDQSWKTVKQLKNIECFHLYAKYLIRMFNDKQKGIKILEEARRLEIEAHEKEVILAGSQANTSEEHGVIFLEFDGKQSGIMYQVNNACEKMFGYNKGELQGRKVNDIMPKLFSIFHDRILENYQQTNRPRMMNKDRMVWGRAKDGFLFPFTICIKPVRNYFSQTSEVYASLKRDLWVKQKAFFFVDNELHLSDISASMIQLYPDIASRIHLKKKIHLSQIIPEYQTVLPALVEGKETHEETITRTYPISPNETYTETITFGMQAEEITTVVAGSIGYYFKLFRGTGMTSYDPNNNAMEGESRIGYVRDAKKDFRLIGSMNQLGKRMVYHGGITKNSELLKTQMLSRISNHLQQERELNHTQMAAEQRIDYAKDIKIKRLYGTIIRQIHELSEPSEINGAEGPQYQEEEEGENSENIKPSELNSILEKEAGNKPIFLLKMLTIIMLVLSTLLSILQYLSIYSHKTSLSQFLTTYYSIASLNSQVMALNQLANKFYLNYTSAADLKAFASETNLLDSFTDFLPLSVSTQLVYSDSSSQTMLQSFAINKLISEGQEIASGSLSTSQLFFIQYNSVNGFDVASVQIQQLIKSQMIDTHQNTLNWCIAYLIICSCLFFLILLSKNIILRRVILKKAEILNIFFQIPRYSCSSIQKECERFIQRLSADNDEDQLEIQLQNEEVQDSNNKKHSQQKKRTIMGEEKTSINFIFVSLLMLIFFLIFPLMTLSVQKSAKQTTTFAVAAGIQAIILEKELATMTSFMNTHIIRPTFPLREKSDANAVIAQQYNKILQLLTSVSSNFFFLGKFMDQEYLSAYNRLFFTNLCNQTSCLTALGQDKGLNNILYNLYDYLIRKYQLISSNNGQYNLTLLYSTDIQTTENNFRLLMKKYWRQLSQILVNGVSRLLLLKDSPFFAVMIVICVLNCTVLMWGWITFYSALEKKIVATEYILTFIPIDQINKNSKIVKYIKEQILRQH